MTSLTIYTRTPGTAAPATRRWSHADAIARVAQVGGPAPIASRGTVDPDRAARLAAARARLAALGLDRYDDDDGTDDVPVVAVTGGQRGGRIGPITGPFLRFEVGTRTPAGQMVRAVNADGSLRVGSGRPAGVVPRGRRVVLHGRVPKSEDVHGRATW